MAEGGHEDRGKRRSDHALDRQAPPGLVDTHPALGPCTGIALDRPGVGALPASSARVRRRPSSAGRRGSLRAPPVPAQASVSRVRRIALEPRGHGAVVPDHMLRTKHELLVDEVEVAMAGAGYIGKHRQRDRTPILASCRRKVGTKISVALAMVATVSGVGGDLGTRETSWVGGVAAQPAAGHAMRTSTAVRKTGAPGNITLGRLTVHLDATRAVVTAIAGDDVNRRLSWRMQVSNRTGAAVTIGDPTAILWAADGSGHLAVSRQRVPPDSQQAATVSFDLPKILEPSSITLTLGSFQAEVKVKIPRSDSSVRSPRASYSRSAAAPSERRVEEAKG